MRSLSSVGLALSLVFGCLFLALMAELYYLIWWKKRINNDRDVGNDEYFNFCWKKSSSLRSTSLNPQEMCASVRMADTQVYQPLSLLHAHQNKEIWLRQLGEEEEEEENEGESLRLQQNISLSGGPPRFLFTIREETREEMESEDGRSRKGSRRRRSLSDLILTVETETETPYLTPMASPLYFTPPMTPMAMDSIRSPNEFNPLLESSTDTEFRKMRSFLASSPSPPPKFKFLKDAEEKLYRKRLREEAEKCNNINNNNNNNNNGSSPNPVYLKDEENGTFITLVIAENNNNNRGQDLSPEIHKLSSSSSSSSQCHSSSLQIVSPTIRSISI